MSRDQPATELWGGAARVTLPARLKFLDVSKLRHVPDNQEVFVEGQVRLPGRTTGDCSVILEILDMNRSLDSASAHDIAAYYWHDLARENNAEDPDALPEKVSEFTPLASFRSNPERAAGHRLIVARGVQTLTCSRIAGAATHTSPADILPIRRTTARHILIYLGILRLPQCSSEILITVNYPDYTDPVDLDLAENYASTIFNSFEIVNWGLFDGAATLH